MGLLRRPDRPTAVFASCDTGDLGVIEAARRASLRVPEDLSVIGFENTFAATWAAPRLTTVHQPLEDMGRIAMRTAIEARQDSSRVTPHVQLITRVVVRESTGPVPA